MSFGLCWPFSWWLLCHDQQQLTFMSPGVFPFAFFPLFLQGLLRRTFKREMSQRNLEKMREKKNGVPAKP